MVVSRLDRLRMAAGQERSCPVAVVEPDETYPVRVSRAREWVRRLHRFLEPESFAECLLRVADAQKRLLIAGPCQRRDEQRVVACGSRFRARLSGMLERGRQPVPDELYFGQRVVEAGREPNAAAGPFERLQAEVGGVVLSGLAALPQARDRSCSFGPGRQELECGGDQGQCTSGVTCACVEGTRVARAAGALRGVALVRQGKRLLGELGGCGRRPTSLCAARSHVECRRDLAVRASCRQREVPGPLL